MVVGYVVWVGVVVITCESGRWSAKMWLDWLWLRPSPAVSDVDDMLVVVAYLFWLEVEGWGTVSSWSKRLWLRKN